MFLILNLNFWILFYLVFLPLNLNIRILLWCFWDLDFLDLESFFGHSPNKAVHTSVDL